MKLFDTHCHLDQVPHDQRTAEDVHATLIPAIHPDAWNTLLGLVAPRTWVALGVHPHALHTLSEHALSKALYTLPERARSSGVVGIGEIGLDGRTAKIHNNSTSQQHLFERQLEIARDLSLPPIIHSVRAHQQTLQSIRRVGLPACGGVLHGYTGSVEMIRKYEQEGLYFGFGGPITWPRAKRPANALHNTPRHRFLLETDAPWQTPYPEPSRPNTPRRLRDVAVRAAEILEISIEDVCCDAWNNARRLFQLEDMLSEYNRPL